MALTYTSCVGSLHYQCKETGASEDNWTHLTIDLESAYLSDKFSHLSLCWALRIS